MSTASSDTIADDMKAAIAAAAGPPRYGDTIEAMLWRAAGVLGISQRRARSFWYRDAKRIEALEYLVITERARALQAKKESIDARNHETRETIARARARLAGRAPDAPIGSAEHLGEMARGNGRGDGE